MVRKPPESRTERKKPPYHRVLGRNVPMMLKGFWSIVD